ncbi:class I SAM-dependent DNA methyltransferase [Deinococcus sp. NW-56]|uniref:type I restriction-modification system subunit M n=1 Tax=Deinococcus sp. NW-56 TaxID=2080419 RepID=UPI0018F86AF1|nr:class I SAM-dependent DNA methyltransferase [Deinococcus sp. NW-56]
MITQRDLEAHLWGAATLLRGKIDASDYKQFIFPLMFFKRISDVWDEEFEGAKEASGGDLAFAALKENHRFQIPTGHHWDDVRAVTVGVGQAIQAALRALEQANPKTLEGIFGDAPWTNKERFSDATLVALLDHFSRVRLDNANVPHDQLGNAYEYLIRQFADDSGHTAQEFYTNRTVVHLMTRVAGLKSGESVYDPTIGTGGLALNGVLGLRDQGQEWRNVKVYGQEVNLITSGIARMNMFLHGIEEFHIARGDTLAEPAFLDEGGLQTFDVVLANPPYSIKRWNRERFAADPYGRNLYGTPPQGNADYAFLQHIIASMNATGRAAVLFPHGVLFRDAEAEMRRKILEDDLIEGVIGLGPNLFYNSPMEACVLVLNRSKPAQRRGQVVMVDGKHQVTRQQAYSFLSPENEAKLLGAWREPDQHPDIARVVSLEEIAGQKFSLSIPLYLYQGQDGLQSHDVQVAVSTWRESRATLQGQTATLFDLLQEASHAD